MFAHHGVDRAGNLVQLALEAIGGDGRVDFAARMLAGHRLHRRAQVARGGRGAIEQLVDRLGQGGGAAIAERNRQAGREVTTGQGRLDPGDVAIRGVKRPDEEC